MSFSLKKTASASSLCAVLLLAACTSQTESAGPSSSPTPSASSSAVTTPSATSSPTASASLLPSEAAPTPTEEASSQAAEPSASPQPTVIEEAPVLVAAGTSCGLSNTGRTSLVVAEGSVSCAEVQQVFADFNIKFNDSTNTINISGYQCNSYSPESTQATGRTVTCVNSTNRLEAMTNYPLGGSPISASDSRFTKINEYGTEIYYFQANGIYCEIGYDRMFGCHRESVINKIFDAETIHWGDGSQLLVSSVPEYGRITEENRAFPTLPAGSTITTDRFACTNDGTYLKCTNGVKIFAANSTEFSEL